MGKRVGLFAARFLMVVMTFSVVFLTGTATRTFAGDKNSAMEAIAVDSAFTNLISELSGVAIIVMIVVILLLGIIGALLLDSKKILER